MHQPQTDTREPLFPPALKKARLARQLKQETLAAQLHIKLRTLVSWETGARIPSVGMVALLSQILLGSFDLESDLMLAYIADDLARQTHLQKNEQFHQLARQTIEQVQTRGRKPEQQQGSGLSLFENQPGKEEQEQRKDEIKTWRQEQRDDGARHDPLQQLFSVLETLREHTELLPVVQEFLHEVTQTE